jgi:hypothetical protein
MAPTGKVFRTGIKAGKEKFSQVLCIQKGFENGTASGVTFRKVSLGGFSRGIRSLSCSWRCHRAMTKEVKKRGECANDNSVDGHLGESELSVLARGELDGNGKLRSSDSVRGNVGAAIGCSSAVPANDNERLVSIDDHKVVFVTGGD